MAELIRNENELSTVRLSLGLESSSPGLMPTVQLEVDRGSELVGQVVLQPEDLNVPPDFDPGEIRYGEPPFAIAERFCPTIRSAVDKAMEGQQILWLEFSPPVGYLALLPWEAILEPVVGSRPIIRTPNFTLFTPLDVERIDVVVCLSEPQAKEPFDGVGFLRRFIPSLLTPPLELSVHVFTDAWSHAQLSQSGELGEYGGRVVMHDPERAAGSAGASVERAIDDSTGGVSNPWLLWMIDEMQESTAEIVHFITHGYAHSGQSALALAESPTRNDDSRWARFVGPTELAACLAQLGAWGVGFTSPPRNYSPLGLRQLFDEESRLRAGPVLFHDAGKDPVAEELAGAYADLFMGRSPMYRAGVSMSAHPGLFAGRTPVTTSLFKSFADTLVKESPLGQVATSTNDPAWVTSTRRYLEQAVARRFPEQGVPSSKVQQAAGKGVGDALRFIDGIISGFEGLEE